MGRYQKRRGGYKNKKKPPGGEKDPQRTRGTSGQSKEDGVNFVNKVLDEGNLKMEVYYASQGLYNTHWNDSNELVPCETNEEKQAERLRWRSIMSEILPSSFRFAKDVPVSLRDKLEAELQETVENLRKEGKMRVIDQLGFLPHAYQLEVDRTTIRKNPDLAKLHEWLKQQTLAGFMTRQETVSMVPPVVLNCQPGDRVLDMCAAPGSKTTQILENLGPQGSLVANDANFKRAQ